MKERFSVPDDQNSTTDNTASEDSIAIANNNAPKIATATGHSSMHKTRKRLLLVAWLVIVIGGGIYWYLTQARSTDSTVEQTTEQSAPAEPVSAQPYGIVYSSTKTTEPVADEECSKSETTVYLKPFSSDATKIFEAGVNNYVTGTDIHQQNIVIATEPGCGSEDKSTLWLSRDSGENFEKIYEGSGMAEDQLADQFTSVVFSNKGNSVLIALLPAGQSDPSNTVKLIDIQTRQSQDLLTENKAGIFIAGYDSKVGKVFYYTGCYNCDGNTRSVLYSHDVTDGSKKTVYDFGDRSTAHHALNSDFSKMLVIKGSASIEGLGDGPPYDVVEIDLASGAETNLHTSKTFIATVGYQATDNTPYYVKINAIFTPEDGKQTALFETENDFYAVYTVSNDNVIASTGSFENERVFRYEYATKAVTSLTPLKEKTTYGIVWR